MKRLSSLVARGLVSGLALGCTERGWVLTPAGETDMTPQGSSPPPLSDAGGVSVTSDAGRLPDAEPSEIPASNVFAVATGDSHSCAISAGRLWCWGNNSSGQLGLGDAVTREQPTLVDEGPNFVAVSAGRTHSCALDQLGQVWCWGGNDHGQLGQGDRQSRSRLVPVDIPEPSVQLSSDADHACARADAGAVYCWGSNAEGQLALGDAHPVNDETSADQLTPVQINEDVWTNIDTGQGHTCAIQADRSLWCWGRNSVYQLANEEQMQSRTALRVGNENHWLDVEAGQNHTCALSLEGALWCWGENNGVSEQEGAPFGTASVEVTHSPVSVDATAAWTALATNTFHSCGLQGEALWCWGRNIEGQLGLGDLNLRYEAEHVGDSYAAVSVGRFHTCAVTTGGDIACTGANDEGRLGTGDRERQNRFAVVLPAN